MRSIRTDFRKLRYSRYTLHVTRYRRYGIAFSSQRSPVCKARDRQQSALRGSCEEGLRHEACGMRFFATQFLTLRKIMDKGDYLSITLNFNRKGKCKVSLLIVSGMQYKPTIVFGPILPVLSDSFAFQLF